MDLQHQAPPPLVVLEAREFAMSYNASASDSSHLPFNFQICYIGGSLLVLMLQLYGKNLCIL